MWLALLAISQAPLALKIEEVDLPVTDCFAEIVLGVEKKSLSVVELKLDNYKKMWDLNGKAPINFTTPRIGTTSWRVTPGLLGSTPCFVIDTLGTRTQTVVRGTDEHELRHRAIHMRYVSETGSLLEETYRLETSGGIWTMEAKFSGDTYSVTMTRPNKPPLKMGPIYPGFDIKELTENPFKPMYAKGGEVKLREKSFRTLNPFTGEAVSHTLLIAGEFSGKHHDKKYKGQKFQHTQGKDSGKYEMYVSDTGSFLRMELKDYMFIELEDSDF